jgi:hypothetical protein
LNRIFTISLLFLFLHFNAFGFDTISTSEDPKDKPTVERIFIGNYDSGKASFRYGSQNFKKGEPFTIFLIERGVSKFEGTFVNSQHQKIKNENSENGFEEFTEGSIQVSPEQNSVSGIGQAVIIRGKVQPFPKPKNPEELTAKLSENLETIALKHCSSNENKYDATGWKVFASQYSKEAYYRLVGACFKKGTYEDESEEISAKIFLLDSKLNVVMEKDEPISHQNYMYIPPSSDDAKQVLGDVYTTFDLDQDGDPEFLLLLQGGEGHNIQIQEFEKGSKTIKTLWSNYTYYETR